MRVLIGYESVMGNTRLVAESIAAGVRLAVPAAHVLCLHVGRLPAEPPDADLFVLGGPTHFHGLPGEWTRQLWVSGVVEASRRGSPAGHQHLEPGAAGPGVREWLAELEDLPPRDLRRGPLLAGPGLTAPGLTGPGLTGPGLTGPGLTGPALDGAALRWRVPADVPGGARLAAVFDTRLARLLAGGASRRIARGLRRHGFRLIAPPEGFVVVDIAGPLRVGEADRAEGWGVQLAELVLPVLHG